MIKKLLLSVLAIFGFALVGVSSANAATTSFSFDSSNYSQSQQLCYGSSDCSPYHYITFSTEGCLGLIEPYSARLQIVSRNVRPNYSEFDLVNHYYLRYGSSATYNIEGSLSIYVSSLDISSWPSGCVVSGTLSETAPGGVVPSGTINISENGTFDVTNYASAVVDVPQTVEGDGSFIVNLFKGGFWNVATAIVGLIVPVLALFLVFRLIHGLIYGKGV